MLVLLVALVGCSNELASSPSAAPSVAADELTAALGPALGELDEEGRAACAATLAFLEAREQALKPGGDPGGLAATCDPQTDLAGCIAAFARGYYATPPAVRYHMGRVRFSLRKLLISGSTAHVLAYAYGGGNAAPLHLITLRRTDEGWLVRRDQADEYDGCPAQDFLAQGGSPHPVAAARSFALEPGAPMAFPPGLLTTLDAYLRTSWRECAIDSEAFRSLWTPDSILQTMPAKRLSEWARVGRTISVGPVRPIGPRALGFCEVVVTTVGQVSGEEDMPRATQIAFVHQFERQPDGRWLLFERPALSK